MGIEWEEKLWMLNGQAVPCHEAKIGPARARAIGDSGGWRITIDRPSFEALLPPGTTLAAAKEEVVAQLRGEAWAILIGTDEPRLPATWVRGWKGRAASPLFLRVLSPLVCAAIRADVDEWTS